MSDLLIITSQNEIKANGSIDEVEGLMTIDLDSEESQKLKKTEMEEINIIVDRVWYKGHIISWESDKAMFKASRP